MTIKKKFVVAGIGFGDIIIIIRDFLKNNPNYEFVGFVDDNPHYQNKKIENYKVVGKWTCLQKMKCEVFNSVAKTMQIRKLAQHKLDRYRVKYINLIHSSSDLGDCKLGKGIAIFNNVFIGNNVKIGSQTIIHSSCSIGHDAEIGNNCFLAPGVKVLGKVKVGNNVLLGSNSVCLSGIKIGDNSKISACSFATEDVPKNRTVLGVPGRIF